MIRSTRIGAIYRKELIDILRDRRTLLAMVVVPVVLYPVVLLGFVRLAEKEEARLRTEKFVILVEDDVMRDQLEAIIEQVHREMDAENQDHPTLGSDRRAPSRPRRSCGRRPRPCRCRDCRSAGSPRSRSSRAAR